MTLPNLAHIAPAPGDHLSWLVQDRGVSWHTGFGVLKLGTFWANWDEFFYSISATLASFLLPKWAEHIPASGPLPLLLALPGTCVALLFPFRNDYWVPTLGMICCTTHCTPGAE